MDPDEANPNDIKIADPADVQTQDTSSGDVMGYSNAITDSSMTKDEQPSMTLSVHDLDYLIKVKKRPCSKPANKQILRNVTGIFKQGMNAIMGPTGSGKTSLLDILAERKDPSGIQGKVLVDGHKQPRNFKCMTGYVVQDDVVMGTLTVRENITFSANVRLPTSVSHKEKRQRVNDVINQLGLGLVADSKVGTEFFRGISGGERKRTNIGMELIIAPPVLFLDEPTTGLDSNTAQSIMKLLQRLSHGGTTIVFSIHQPRYSIYKLFDTLMLLALGRVVYHGPAMDTLKFFSQIGYECEEHNNPADFFLDITNAGTKSLGDDQNNGISVGVDGDLKSVTVATLKENTAEATAEKFAEEYKKTTWFNQIKSEADAIIRTAEMQGAEAETIRAKYVTSFAVQLKYVTKRAATNLFRNPQSSITQLISTIFFAVLVGLVFMNTDETLPEGLQNRIGAMFFIIMTQIFVNLSAIEVFIKEKPIFLHESSSGFYRVSAYFFAKVIGDTIPFRAIPVTVFCLITYFFVGFRMEVGKFFIYYLTLFLTTICASTIGFCMGSSFRVYAIANLMTALTFVLMMIFGGLLVNLRTMVVWLRWLQYLSLFRHSLNTLLINELKDLELCVNIETVNATLRRCDTTAANEYLETLGISYETTWNLWTGEVVLFILTIFFLTCAYIRLVNVNRHT